MGASSGKRSQRRSIDRLTNCMAWLGKGIATQGYAEEKKRTARELRRVRGDGRAKKCDGRVKKSDGNAWMHNERRRDEMIGSRTGRRQSRKWF